MQKAIIETAQLTGWLVAHFRPARTEEGWRTAVEGDGKGFPDLVLCRSPAVLFVEVKSKGGRLSREQDRWRLGLELAGASYQLVRPDNFDWFLENVVRFGNTRRQ